MDLNRFCLKIFASEPVSAGILDCVPVFHRWIQKHSVENHLLIDVADYSHVWQGPGIVLVAHEANFSTDQSDGRLGLLYQRKRPLEGDLETRIQAALRTTLKACQRLSADLEGRINFRGDQLEISLNDRLRAPSEEKTLASLESIASKLGAVLFHDAATRLDRSTTTKRRPRITLSSDKAHEIGTLLERTP